MKTVLLNENFRLWTLLHHSADALAAVRAKEIAKFNITALEHRVLLQIPIMENTPGVKVTASELSRWIFRNRSSLSALLARMEKRGLVRIVPQPGDKKSRIIKITEKGKELSEKGFNEGMTFVNRTISSLSEEERQQLWVIVRKLRNKAYRELKLTRNPPFPQFV